MSIEEIIKTHRNDWAKEIERLRLSCQLWEADALRYAQNAADARDLAIEECASVAESLSEHFFRDPIAMRDNIAAAIRALKD